MQNFSTVPFPDLPFDESKPCDRERRLSAYVSHLEHQIFFLFVFLASEELSSEACEFLESHDDDPMPFSFRPF